ncbi:MAG: carbon storage regulator [Gammaproteobacteria bacterium]|nr:carbon storage regulator [Gammaproteobacteria bacterium]
MLALNVPFGDSLVIDEGRIVITFQKRSGADVRVLVDADRSIPVKVSPKERPNPISKGLTVPK